MNADRAATEPVEELSIGTTVNGREVSATVPVRRLLADFLRDDLGLTGTHVGCEHGVCGACTVLIDGQPARSCITLAVASDGHEVSTVEGLSPPAAGLSPLQQSFRDAHGLQCGFCTPGILATISAADPDEYPDDEAIRDLLGGHLCRCTGYESIVAAVRHHWGRSES